MNVNNSGFGILAPELEIQTSTLTGGWDLIGVFIEQPVHIIFDNQSDVEVKITDDRLRAEDDTTQWHTFPIAEAIVLDMRANHGIAANYSFSKGKAIYAKGTAGAPGKYFRISYTYAKG